MNLSYYALVTSYRYTRWFIRQIETEGSLRVGNVVYTDVDFYKSECRKYLQKWIDEGHFEMDITVEEAYDIMGI